MKAEKLGFKRLEELGGDGGGRSGKKEGGKKPVGERAGIERELKVIRVGPNPRLVVCEYMELAERRVCLVNVKRNLKWIKGMRFRMEEPVNEEEYIKPWVYKGKGPRLRGRW